MTVSTASTRVRWNFELVRGILQRSSSSDQATARTKLLKFLGISTSSLGIAGRPPIRLCNARSPWGPVQFLQSVVGRRDIRLTMRQPDMSRRKVFKSEKRVWRLSESNPAGGFVSRTGRQVTSSGRGEVHESGFHASSLELSDGSQVIETALDTLPGELIDAFVKPKP